jgi:glycosyltransferase involved in cell wall biosynthesis
MRICFVISGSIDVQPSGIRRWGAVESIQHDTSEALRELGHVVHIKWLDQVKEGDYDIVHIMVANLCIQAHKRGLKYIYGLHDHTSYHFGKGSELYNQQLEAIKHSIFSICHAEYVVDFFDTDKLFFVRHGVSTNYYKPIDVDLTNGHSLLLIGNNGMAGQNIDRKGFRVAIDSAKALDLPITIIGADGNKRFFEANQDLLEYPKLTEISDNIDESQKYELMKQCSIMLQPSSIEFGVPNLATLEGIASCLPIVGTLKGYFGEIKGFKVISEPNVNELIDGIKYTIENYQSLREQMLQERYLYDWSRVCLQLQKMYASVVNINNTPSQQEIKEKYIHLFNK